MPGLWGLSRAFEALQDEVGSVGMSWDLCVQSVVICASKSAESFRKTDAASENPPALQRFSRAFQGCNNKAQTSLLRPLFEAFINGK